MPRWTTKRRVPPRWTKPPRKGKSIVEVPGRLSQLMTAGLAPIRHLRPVRPLSKQYPEGEVRAMDAKWYRLASYDSAIVSMNDGTSAALYQRDPAKFRELVKETVQLHDALRRDWQRLSAEYRAALGDITSPETWEKTLAPWMTDDD